ncbi:MAG: fused response regulator/phosphatase [Pseudomonadales bacterium]|jgi:CheY-like chemotaxis protein
MSVGDSNILVVGPQESVDSELIRTLKDSGFVTTNATTEVDCLSVVNSTKQDLVLLSLPNKDIDAFSLLSNILKYDEDLPIILIIVGDDVAPDMMKNEDEKIVALLEAGAADFLSFETGRESLLRYVVDKQLEQKPKPASLHLVESLKTLERDQQAGFRVQQGMMPTSPTTFGKITFDHQIFPSLILSGDFIDYFELPNGKVLFYIADVSGHGASSAFVTVLLKSLSRRLEHEFDALNLGSTSEILQWLNRELLLCDLEQHVTMFIGIIDKENFELQYSNAAQFPAAILSSGGQSQFLEIGGLPLGLYQVPEYDSRAVILAPGFSIVMFSDGVFEIMSEQTLKAKEEHLLSVVEYGKRNVEALAEQLGIASIRNVPDDIAVFTVAGAG